jgi:SAM-dependent methyltransferase
MKFKLLRKGFNSTSYSRMQKKFYARGTSDHIEHNANLDYWNILLRGVNNENFAGKSALDFACGKGRNVKNLLSLADWKTVDGSDLSQANIQHCRNFFSGKSNFFTTAGADTGIKDSDSYDFIMTTISLQHIPVYEIRKRILQDILRILKPGGRFSFQMGFGFDLTDPLGRPRSAYYENYYSANSTNGDHDVRVTSEEEIQKDLFVIGFRNISSIIRDSFSDLGHPKWIYVECYKPIGTIFSQ